MSRKKLLFIFLLTVLLSVTSTYAQVDKCQVESKTGSDTPLETMWDVKFNYDLQAITGANGNAGVVYIPTLEQFWVSRWSTGVITVVSKTGQFVETFTLPVTGTRGMAFDGQYVYHSVNTNTLQKVDPVSKTIVGTVALPSGVTARFITYDPTADGGQGGFWLGNWNSGALNYYLVSKTGTQLAVITNTAITGTYGIACDNWSDGGPYLWVWSQGSGYQQPQNLIQISIATGLPTGVQHDVKPDIAIVGDSSLAGGLFITDQLISGTVVLGGVFQGSPDKLFGYELLAQNGTIFADDFESYTTGQKLACQAPTVWTTWSNAPCGSEDAEVSTEYAYNGTKSVKVVYNNDLVKDFGTPLTTGKYKISFYIYIPTGKAAYFNTLASFNGTNSEWGIEVHFDAGGAGRVNPSGSVPATFQWTANTWHYVEHVVDLDNDFSQLYINGSLVHSQVWTLGAYTTAVTKALDANDFFGATTNDQYYIDNYMIEDLLIVPVELTSFAATQNGSQITLNWTTATETNNHGFEVERRVADSENWVVIGFKQGAGTTTSQNTYTYADDISMLNTTAVSYRLKQIDFDGKFEYSNEILVDKILPTSYSIYQNYPNPFNPVTTIKYQLPADNFVSLKIYNSLGEEVSTIINGMVSAGTHEVNFDAKDLSSGVYLYVLRAGENDFIKTMKMILMK